MSAKKAVLQRSKSVSTQNVQQRNELKRGTSVVASVKGTVPNGRNCNGRPQSTTAESPSLLRHSARRQTNISSIAPTVKLKIPKPFAGLTTGQVNQIRQSWHLLYTSNVLKQMHKVMSRIETKYSRTKDVFYMSAFLPSKEQHDIDRAKREAAMAAETPTITRRKKSVVSQKLSQPIARTNSEGQTVLTNGDTNHQNGDAVANGSSHPDITLQQTQINQPTTIQHNAIDQNQLQVPITCPICLQNAAQANAIRQQEIDALALSWRQMKVEQMPTLQQRREKDETPNDLSKTTTVNEPDPVRCPIEPSKKWTFAGPSSLAALPLCPISTTENGTVMLNGRNSTLNDHSRMLVTLFEKMIICLRDGEATTHALRVCGAKHAVLKDCGLRPDFWEAFGEACLEVFQSVEAVQANKEMSKIWRVVIACMTHELRTGFEEQVRHHLHFERTILPTLNLNLQSNSDKNRPNTAR